MTDYPDPDARDQQVLVYGQPCAVTRAEAAQLEELALDRRDHPAAMVLARTYVTRDAVCVHDAPDMTAWDRCPRHEPRGFPMEPCPPPVAVPKCGHRECVTVGHPAPDSIRADCIQPASIPSDRLRVPVVTDPRMPRNTFLIGSPDHPARVLMAPVGTAPDEPGWHDVGTLDTLALTAPTFTMPDDLTPWPSLAAIRDRYEQTLTIRFPQSDPAPRDTPTSTRTDPAALLTGARQAALTRLAALCHTATRKPRP